MAILSAGHLQHEVIVEVFIYALGVITNTFPLSVLAFILLAGIIRLVILPMVWPPHVLQETEAQIKDMESFLHDECGRRRNTAMTNISAAGLTRLLVLQADLDRLSDHHRTLFRLSHVHRYLHDVYKLSRDSQQCLRDVKDLRIDLKQQIRALDHPAVPGRSEVNAGALTPNNTSLSVTNSADTMV